MRWANGPPNMLWNVLEILIPGQTSKTFIVSISNFKLFWSARGSFLSIRWWFKLVFLCFRYFVLGLPTGSTPLGMYRKLVEYYEAGHISFKFVKTFNMDEYASTWAICTLVLLLFILVDLSLERTSACKIASWIMLMFYVCKISHLNVKTYRGNIQKAITILCGAIFSSTSISIHQMPIYWMAMQKI